METLQYHAAVLLLILVWTSGCRMFSHDNGTSSQSLLKPAGASPNSTTMEIIWLRFPADDPELNTAAWQEVDETAIEPSVRRELASNGFRVGIVGATLPEALARALNRDASPKESIPRTATQTIDLTAEPVVHGRIQQLRRNQRSEIQASEVYPSLPLLVRGGGELSGRPYEQAQAIYALRVDPQPDRTALVELTPELHYGPPHIRYTRGEDNIGVLHQAIAREREVFQQLRVSVKLAPGEMLLLMSLPNSGCQLAEYFHTAQSSDGRQQKLILIRLADVPESNTFANIAAD
jgi:hypothetical protein